MRIKAVIEHEGGGLGTQGLNSGYSERVTLIITEEQIIAALADRLRDTTALRSSLARLSSPVHDEAVALEMAQEDRVANSAAKKETT